MPIVRHYWHGTGRKKRSILARDQMRYCLRSQDLFGTGLVLLPGMMDAECRIHRRACALLELCSVCALCNGNGTDTGSRVLSFYVSRWVSYICVGARYNILIEKTVSWEGSVNPFRTGNKSYTNSK